MTENTKPSDDLPPIDTSKIKIDIIELDPPDYQFDIEVPVDLVAEITTRLKDGGTNYNEQELGNLIVQISQDEAMQRLDKDSAGGCRVLRSSKGKHLANEPFKFSAITDTIPNETLSIDKIPITRRSFKVTESLIEAELFEQQLQIGTRNSFEGNLAYGDEITCDIKCVLQNSEQPIADIKNYTLSVPNENQVFLFQGIPLSEIGMALRSSQTSPNLIFQFLYQGEKGSLELKNCQFSRITPASIDQVLEKYGTPNEALLRTQIKLSLQNNFDRENTNSMLFQFYNYLLEHIDIPISQRLVKQNFKKMSQSALDSTNQQELSKEDKEMLLKKAAHDIKRWTINTWIARRNNIHISEEDINEQIGAIAEERRVRPSDVRDEFLGNDKIQLLASVALERKIFESFKNKMVFTDI